MSELQLNNVSVNYGESTVLREIDFSIERGENVGIIGPNGAGKTTLLNAISGLKSYHGSIKYRGGEVRESKSNELVNSGLVHISEERNLFGPMTVEDNLRMGAATNRDSLTDQLEEIYSIFPRLSERRDQEAKTLSGGEQQMLSIGRGLMADPNLLMIDEPSQGLAPVIIDDLYDIMEKMYDDMTILIVEQNAKFVFDQTEWVHILENGQISKSGKADEIQEDDYVRDAFLGV
jgi:branched-chain amino acid transport system ATP-binding protein